MAGTRRAWTGRATAATPPGSTNMDLPDHTRREIAGWIEDLTTELLDDVADRGPGADFMELFAWKLPLRVVSGIQSDRRRRAERWGPSPAAAG
jgi:cytochrome P450